MTSYPTDLVLAVEHAQTQLSPPHTPDITTLLNDAQLPCLSALFHTTELTKALDELFDGLSQYPWQVLPDSNDVYELTPIGNVVLLDERPGNTLRGLLLGWATGNQVTIRTARPALWQHLIDCLRRPGYPLPHTHLTHMTNTTPGTPIQVPDLWPTTPDGRPLPEPAWTDPALYTDKPTPHTPVMEIQVGPHQHDAETFARSILRMDCQAPWTRQLYHRTYLRGTTLAQARARQSTHNSGRLDAKLRYLTQRARRAPHYRNLPPVTGLQDLKALPILDKTSLTANSLPASTNLCTGDQPSGEVLRSGATTGAPRYIVYSRTDWNNMVREAIPLFYAMGLAPGDRLINTLFGGGLYGGMTTTVTEFTKMPIECYTTGQAITVDSLLTLVNSFSANALIGVPTLILPLLREAKERQPELTIDKVLYLGTAMSESDKAWLHEQLHTHTVSSVLAANDGAQIGYQCRHLSGRLHHVNDDYNYIEVVSDAGVPLPQGEVGDLLITSMQKLQGPLIRYRVGDQGRIFTHECPCGISGRILEYHGRTDGLIRVRGELIRYDEIHAELAAFGISELQADIASKEGREILTLKTESAGPLDAAAMRSHLAQKFTPLGAAQLFDDTLDAFEFRIECHRLGALDRNPASGKVKPVIDRRLQ